MPITVYNDALRSALDLPDHTHEHAKRIAEVALSFPHTVVHVASPSQETCGTYALGLMSKPGYVAIASTYGDVFAGRGFFTWLVKHNRLNEIGFPDVPSLVLYFAGSEWRHAGVMTRPGRVISKWGECPVYEHGITEILLRYGDVVRFYKMPSPAESFAWYCDYAGHCKVPSTVITSARAQIA